MARYVQRQNVRVVIDLNCSEGSTMTTSVLGLLLYVVAALSIGSRLFHNQGPDTRIALGLGAAAIVLHVLSLTGGIFSDPGQNMSMTNVASLIALLITISMSLTTVLLPNLFLLPVVYGFAALVIALNLLVPDTYIMHIEVHPTLLVHVTLALFAYGCLVIALLYALQLAYINGQLKQKHAAMLTSPLPPLMAVENILFKLLISGTVLLGLSLISGFAFLDNMFAREQAHKTVFSLIAFAIFTSVLAGHKLWGWRGKPVIASTVVGTILLTLAYFGSRFVREVLLS